MLPLSDGLHPRRFPFVNVALIAANFAVWILYELPHLGSAVYHASFYPCAVDGSCHAPEPWGISWFTAMFMHGSWDHILGNMLFLAIFGKNVEDAFGHLRYLALLHRRRLRRDDDADRGHPALRLGVRRARPDARRQRRDRRRARRLHHPVPDRARSGRWLLVFLVQIPAWVYLGGWFLYQLVEAHPGLASAAANGGGVAFFAHVGGFAFGATVAAALLNAGRVVPQSPARRPALARH